MTSAALLRRMPRGYFSGAPENLERTAHAGAANREAAGESAHPIQFAGPSAGKRPADSGVQGVRDTERQLPTRPATLPARKGTAPDWG